MRDEMAEMRSTDTDENIHMSGESDAEDDQGEDFDDFEAGAGDADFGDFDDGFQQPSLFTDHSSDTNWVDSTKPVLCSPPSPFVSGFIAKIATLAHRWSISFFLSFFFPLYCLSIRSISKVADTRSSSSPFLILASLNHPMIWSLPARHILIRYSPPLRFRGLLLFPQRQRTTQSSLQIEAFHYGHSLWPHRLYSPQIGFVRVSAVYFLYHWGSR